MEFQNQPKVTSAFTSKISSDQYEVLIENRNEKLRARLIPKIQKTYKKGVMKIHQIITRNKDELEEAELLKANCKCRVERIVAGARARMGIENDVKPKNNLKDCLNCYVKK